MTNATEAMHAVRRFLNNLPDEAISDNWQDIETFMRDLGWDETAIENTICANEIFKDRDPITTIPAWAERNPLDIAVTALNEIATTMPYSMSMVMGSDDGFMKSRAQVITAKQIAIKALDSIR